MGTMPGGRAPRILVVEDDHDLAVLTQAVLTRRGGFEVGHAADPGAALALLAAEHWDLLLTDLRLPGRSGTELVREARRVRPGLPAIVMTAYASVDAAVDALRLGVADFLLKPVDPVALVAQVSTVLARAAADRAQEVVLAVGAHPDDVEIAVGGTLLGHRRAGDEVVIVTLSAGAAGGAATARRAEARAAAEALGARLVLLDLEDTRIAAGNPTVGLIEEVVADVRPTVLYAHSVNDLHQDHRAAHQASLVAGRRVPRVYCFESPSSTVAFQPTRFTPIDGHLEAKLAAIALHESQTDKCDYLAPDLLRATARYWGRHADGDFAEPFEVVRDRAPSLAEPLSQEDHHAAA